MNSAPDKYSRLKILLAKFMGLAVLIVSMQFSQNGFGFKDQNIFYVGWVLAIAVTVVQFVFNSKVKNLNWTITVLGIMAYVYSIWTNIIGFYKYQGKILTFETLLSFDAILPVFASAFMDIFPETILAWAFNVSSDGDLIGNIIAVAENPENIFNKFTNKQGVQQVQTQNNTHNNSSMQNTQRTQQHQQRETPRDNNRNSQHIRMNPEPVMMNRKEEQYTNHPVKMSEEDRRAVFARLQKKMENGDEDLGL